MDRLGNQSRPGSFGLQRAHLYPTPAKSISLTSIGGEYVKQDTTAAAKRVAGPDILSKQENSIPQLAPIGQLSLVDQTLEPT